MSHSTPSGSWDEPYYRVHTEHFEAAFLPDADEDLDAVTDIDVEVQPGRISVERKHVHGWSR